jgi:ribose transport system substrate-binding protein
MSRFLARTALVIGGLALASAAAKANDDPSVSAAKSAVQLYAGPQTAWNGPTSAPKPAKGKFIVYVSADEQNDISREYGLYMKQAAAYLGWKVVVIDGKGNPETWLASFSQAIALHPDGIATEADAKSLQGPIKLANQRGIPVIGLHSASLPGPAPDLGLFVNIQEDPRQIGKAEADWAIADSNGKARVVVITHNEYQIAATKSGATRDAIKACAGCKVLAYVDFPASEAAQRMPQLTTTWVQSYGLPIYITSVGDNDLDFAIPSLRADGVPPGQAKLIGADGNRSAYERIRKGNQYQVVTISEPIELQAYQAIDEFNRAFNKQPPSGFVQTPFLVVHGNINNEGGPHDIFEPENDYKDHYLTIWGVKN